MKRFLKATLFAKIVSIILPLTLWSTADITTVDIQKPKIANGKVRVSYEQPSHDILSQSDSSVPKHWQELIRQSETLTSQGKYKQAQQVLKEAIDWAKMTQPVAYSEIIQSLNTLSRLYCKQVKYDKALLIVQQALKISKSQFGNKNLLYASSLSTLAYVLAHNKQYDKAMEYNQNTLLLYKYELHIDDTAVADIYLNIAYIYYKQKQYEKSIEFIDKAVVLLTNKYGINSQKLIKPYIGLADAYSAISQYGEAKLYYSNSIDILKQSKKPTPINSYILYKSIVHFYIKVREYDKAELIAKKYIVVSNKIFGAKSDKSIAALKVLAQIYQATNDTQKKRAIDEQIYGTPIKTTQSDQADQNRSCQDITLQQDIDLYQKVYKHYSKLNSGELSQYGFARYYITQQAVSLIVPLAWEQKSDSNNTLLSLSKKSVNGATIEFSLQISEKFWNKEEQKLPKELLKKVSKRIASRYIENSQKAGTRSQVVTATKLYDYNTYIVAHQLLSTDGNSSKYRGDTLLWNGSNIYILTISSNKKNLLLEEFLSSLVIESFCSMPYTKKQTDIIVKQNRDPLYSVKQRVKELERRLNSLDYSYQ